MADPYTGEIRIWPGQKAPSGWHLCDGTLLSIKDNPVLFALIGTTYGGDAKTTFGLPDLRNRLAIHYGSGPDLSARTLGAKGGADTVTLTDGQIPSHTHTVTALNVPATTTTLTGNYLAAVGNGMVAYETVGHGETLVPMNVGAVSADGGLNQPHNNDMPSMSLFYIICLQGLYPERNN